MTEQQPSGMITWEHINKARRFMAESSRVTRSETGTYQVHALLEGKLWHPGYTGAFSLTELPLLALEYYWEIYEEFNKQPEFRPGIPLKWETQELSEPTITSRLIELSEGYGLWVPKRLEDHWDWNPTILKMAQQRKLPK